MGKNTSIEWKSHTFNPWWGCVKVSLGCDNCYAEKWSKRTGDNIWGANSERKFFSDNHWSEPLKWEKDAAKKHIHQRVFCASMGDVFEDRDDLNPWREKLWALIDQTPNLDWLLLTKRVNNIKKIVPWEKDWPVNVFLGATIENQEIANEKIPVLLDNNASLHFISCEPLLGHIDIVNWLSSKKHIKWVIVGGESGARARAANPQWIKSLRDQCKKYKVPFLFKQWGAWRPAKNIPNKKIFKTDDREDMIKLSKKYAGRDLDGRIWNEVP
jgi:protein gp37